MLFGLRHSYGFNGFFLFLPMDFMDFFSQFLSFFVLIRNISINDRSYLLPQDV